MSSKASSSLNELLSQVARQSPKKWKLLETLLKEEGLDPLQILPIPRRQEGRFSPLSFPQQRLWLVERLSPGEVVYNVPTGIRFKQGLNTAALEQSLNEIVRRHEVLRTSIQTIEGRPMQVIEPELCLSILTVDLGELSAVAQEKTGELLIEAFIQRQFDFTHGPLLRAILIRIEPTDQMLTLTLHHLITDAWSISLLINELRTLYRHYCSGAPSELAELPIQYGDYAEWQRQSERHETLNGQLNYWIQHLADAPKTLDLPIDRPRSLVRTFARAHLAFTWPRELCDAIIALSRREDVTLFMVLLAAYQVLLHRYTGQQRISVGSPIANRGRTETENMIGCFINVLVLCTDLSGGPSFRELLHRVRDITLAAYAHQDVHFEQLVKALQPERDLSRTPLIQVTFTFQNIPGESRFIPDETFTPFNVGISAVEHDLSLIMESRFNLLSGIMIYNSDLFRAATINQMLNHLRIVLEQAVIDPELPILRIPLTQERQDVDRAGEPGGQIDDEMEEFAFGLE